MNGHVEVCANLGGECDLGWKEVGIVMRDIGWDMMGVARVCDWGEEIWCVKGEDICEGDLLIVGM